MPASVGRAYQNLAEAVPNHSAFQQSLWDWGLVPAAVSLSDPRNRTKVSALSSEIKYDVPEIHGSTETVEAQSFFLAVPKSPSR